MLRDDSKVQELIAIYVNTGFNPGISDIPWIITLPLLEACKNTGSLWVSSVS